MKTESCRDRRPSLGAYALGDLSEQERAGLEAHLEGCPGCRAEVDSLLGVARLLPYADPDHFGPAPQPSPELGARIAATIGAERQVVRRQRRRRRRFALGFAGVATATAAVLAIVLLSGRGGDVWGGPEQHVRFSALPSGVEIDAVLEPHSYGTEIHVYVKGMRSGTLCRVFLRGAGGASVSAGTFRYRWGDDSQAVLSSALDLSRTEAIGIHAGDRTFIAPVDRDSAAFTDNETEEDPT